MERASKGDGWGAVKFGCTVNCLDGGITGKAWLEYPPLEITIPETNIAPENRPLEKEIPIGNYHF